MISGQLQAHDSFNEKILESFRRVPRELFVPAPLKEVAYVEGALPLSSERTLMAPLMLAKILKQVPLQKNHSLMIVGGGTGYSAAILSPLVSTLFFVEPEKDLMDQARKNLDSLHVDNVVFSETPLRAGVSQQDPFHFILIEGGVTDVPDTLFHQLRSEDGVLAACVISGPLQGEVTLFKRENYTIHKEKIMGGYLTPLKEFTALKEFDFS